MSQRKPTIIEQQVTDNQAILTVKVDAGLTDFQGHFEDYPLLPGVTQIDWAVYYAKSLLDCQGEFAGMEVIKFQEPILPDSTVTLTLKWVAEKQKLHFVFNSGDKQHSSGRIMLVSSC